ncbi:uncharacterized protein LOC111869100 [Cryptotermes secundus]|uniref:uncharacterized protein LOC111869100 n=1 Tax=Cryptotermes secundus TaxID=105785 RepID=UPI000CD7B3E9|nr:uncharacterized protein LOC111869100 [Cryptotermes secundus]
MLLIVDLSVSMGQAKERKCREPDWLRDLEARLCSVIVVISFTIAIISLGLFTDSAILSLSVEFTPAICRTTNVKHLNGSTNCLWTSCRQSCTATVYNCSQIYVNYMLNDTNVNDTFISVADNSTYPSWSLEDSSSLYVDMLSDMETNSSSVNSSLPLYVNVNGCGYEPEVSCHNFYQQYGNAGISFNCEVSFSVDPPIVIPDSPLNIDTDKTALINYLVLSLMPLVFFFVCSLYIYWRKLFKPKPKKDLRRCVKKKRVERSGKFFESKVKEMNTLEEAKTSDSPAELLSVRSVESQVNSKQEAPKQACPSFINVPVSTSTAVNVSFADWEQFL